MSTHEIALHPLLKPIDINTYPKERAKELWEHLKEQPYAFDDITRNDPEYFLQQFILPTNQFFEIGNMGGLVSLCAMHPGVNASLHFAVWSEFKITDLMQAGKSLMGMSFDQFGLNRLTATIPQANESAKRLAILLGFKYEGALRKAFLSNEVFYDIMLYGILRDEFETVRRF